MTILFKSITREINDRDNDVYNWSRMELTILFTGSLTFSYRKEVSTTNFHNNFFLFTCMLVIMIMNWWLHLIIKHFVLLVVSKKSLLLLLLLFDDKYYIILLYSNQNISQFFYEFSYFYLIVIKNTHTSDLRSG